MHSDFMIIEVIILKQILYVSEILPQIKTRNDMIINALKTVLIDCYGDYWVGRDDHVHSLFGFFFSWASRYGFEKY